MRIVVLKGQSQYGSLRLHGDQLAAALGELGETVALIDLVLPHGFAAFDTSLKAGVDCVIAFSGIIGREYADALAEAGATFAGLYVDHPLHQMGRLEQPTRQYLAFFLDRTHQALVQAVFPPRTFTHIGFLPPGANTLAEPVDVSPEAYARRDIPILFSGTYRGAPARTWQDQSGPTRDLLNEVADRMAADGSLWIGEALKATLQARGLPLTPEFLKVALGALASVQLFAEAYHRDAFVEAMGKAGVAITTVGKGWEPLVARFPSFSYLGEGSFEETLALLRRTRVVINVNNGFVSGGHERVFAAMAGGAAVFSETSLFYQEVFKDGEDLVMFNTPVPADTAARLQALAFEDIDAAAQIAASGHAATLAHHLWSHRAADLMTVVRAARG